MRETAPEITGEICLGAGERHRKLCRGLAHQTQASSSKVRAYESDRLAFGLLSSGIWSPAPIWMIIGRPVACIAVDMARWLAMRSAQLPYSQLSTCKSAQNKPNSITPVRYSTADKSMANITDVALEHTRTFTQSMPHSANAFASVVSCPREPQLPPHAECEAEV